jgi:hypothetical protein
VYQYMKAQYDQLTNEGATYDPDIHDPLVANQTAAKFGISAAEAGRIYVEKDMESVGY